MFHKLSKSPDYMLVSELKRIPAELSLFSRTIPAQQLLDLGVDIILAEDKEPRKPELKPPCRANTRYKFQFIIEGRTWNSELSVKQTLWYDKMVKSHSTQKVQGATSKSLRILQKHIAKKGVDDEVLREFQNMWATVDTDKNGYLDKQEASVFFGHVYAWVERGKSASKEKANPRAEANKREMRITQWIQDFDPDHSGTIDESEFIEGLKALFQKMKE